MLLWDADSGEAIATLNGHPEGITACAWLPSSQQIASAGEYGTLRLCDANSGEAIDTMAGHPGMIWACAWSPDGRRIVSAGEDGTLRLWDTNNGRVLRIHAAWWDADTHPCHAVWEPEENRLTSASDDAWRYLGWQYQDGDGRLSRMPLETFSACVTPPAALGSANPRGAE